MNKTVWLSTSGIGLEPILFSIKIRSLTIRRTRFLLILKGINKKLNKKEKWNLGKSELNEICKIPGLLNNLISDFNWPLVSKTLGVLIGKVSK